VNFGRSSERYSGDASRVDPFGSGPCGCSPKQKGVRFYTPLALPNYYSSLDACAQFEATLNKDERYRYYTAACQIINEDNRTTPFWCGVSPFHYITMTAPQRCLAFLKVKVITPPASGLTE